MHSFNEGSNCPQEGGTATHPPAAPFECIYGRPFLCTDIVIDPETLELTNYVTQLSAFQQALTELQEMTPTQPLSQVSLYVSQELRAS